MKMMAPLLLLALSVSAHATQGPSPIEQIVTMLSDLASKVIGEGEDSHKTFAEFSEWCEDRSKDLEFEIKTANQEIAELQASIDEQNALQGELDAKVEELSGEIATDEADLKAANEIRDKEFADFKAEETELVDIVSMLDRAVQILTREMQKSNADYRSGATAMLQLKNAGSVTDAIRIMVQAAMLSSAEGSKLTALVQSNQGSDDSDSDFAVNAPAATVYEGHSGNIIKTLEDLHDKASSQLDTLRKTETQNVNNFQMLKQDLEDEIKFGNKDLAKAQKSMAESKEKEAADQGDLEVTTKELKADTKALADLHHLCMTKASDFEAEQKSREDELKAIAEAKKVILETTSGAASQQYGLNQLSFIQRSTISTHAQLASFEAVRFVRDLAHKYNAPALSQLASRMSYAMHFSNGDDPFAKIKGLISDMISKLEAEAEADATEKAYCDKEISETNTKRADKNAEIEKLSTSIDQKSSRSTKLKEEVATLQKELADLAASQAEMDKIREEENKAYVKNKAEMELGLEGVKKALKILRDYYASASGDHAAAEGAGAGIIGLLEVVESDFSKSLAEMIATEETAQSDYDAESKENEIDKTTKDQDVKYKTKEFTDLDKAVAELSSDRSGVQAELDAVMEYLRSLDARCAGTLGTSEFGNAKAESYSDRKARRQAEIAGLKEALTILEGEASTVLIQKSHSLRGLRSA